MAGPATGLWMRLAQSLKSLWDDGKAEPVAKSQSKSAKSSSFDVAAHANSLRDQLLNDPTLQAKLHIISLEEFRETVGEKWPRLVDKISIIVEQVIRRHAGRDSPFCRDGEDSWIIAFPKLSPVQASEKAQIIVDDLGRHLFGGDTPLAQKNMAVAAEVPVRDAVSESGELNSARIYGAVAQRRAALGPSRVADSDNRWTSLERGQGSATRGDDMGWDLMNQGSGRKSAFSFGEVGELPPTARLSLLWRPTWVASGEAISAYSARICRVDSEGAEPIEGVRCYPPDDEKTALALDRFVVANAVRDIIQAGRSGNDAANQSSVIIPISWATLASEQRGGIIVPFSDLTQATRNSRLVVEIFGIPDGTATQQMESVVAYMRSLCGNVLVRTRLSSSLTSVANEIGVSMVGLDLSELRPEEKMDDEHLLATMDRIQESTAKDGIGCYLWSARRRKVVGGLVQGGLEMVNGPGLMKDINRPAIVVPAPRSKFAVA